MWKAYEKQNLHAFKLKTTRALDISSDKYFYSDFPEEDKKKFESLIMIPYVSRQNFEKKFINTSNKFV